jgi:hypothetical protein
LLREEVGVGKSADLPQTAGAKQQCVTPAGGRPRDELRAEIDVGRGNEKRAERRREGGRAQIGTEHTWYHASGADLQLGAAGLRQLLFDGADLRSGNQPRAVAAGRQLAGGRRQRRLRESIAGESDPRARRD